MFESIKADRSLSLSNWRYRLLHWTLGANPKTVEEAVTQHGINRMFYTHYCPLFHLTNFIAIFLPLVVIFKIGYYLLLKAHAYAQYRAEQKCMKKQDSKPTDTSSVERKMLLKIMKEYPDRDFSWVWERVYIYCSHEKMSLSDEEAEAYFNKYQEIIKQSAAKKKAKEERRRKNIIFWVNFSQVFVKFGLNIFYVGLAGSMLWLLWACRGLFASVFFGIWTFDVLAFLLLSLTVLLKVTLACLVIYVLYHVSKKRLAGIFSVVGAAIFELLVWVGTKVSDVKDFIEMFYEENCPVINIVSDEEAELQ